MIYLATFECKSQLPPELKLIDKEYTDHPFYGSRQMRNALRRKGFKINRKRVQRLTQILHRSPVVSKKNCQK